MSDRNSLFHKITTIKDQYYTIHNKAKQPLENLNITVVFKTNIYIYIYFN